MNDELLFERLTSHDGPAALDSAFEGRLYSILQREVRRGRTLRAVLLLAATLVLVLTITAAIAVGSGLIRPPWSDRSLTPTPMPTTASPIQSPNDTAAGTYTINPLLGSTFEVTYTQPEGWSATQPEGWSETSSPSPGCLVPATGQLGPDGMGICFFTPRVMHGDPCRADSFSSRDMEVGPTVDDFASALVAQTAYEVTTPTDVTLSGYSGKRMDLQIPDIDFATCDGGRFAPWYESISAQGPGNRWHLWILDVDGLRVVIVAHDFPGTPTDDQEELFSIVESFRIQPFVHGWPGAAENPPGRYSFDAGRWGSWMHNGYQTLDEGQGVEVSFGFSSAPDPNAIAVTVAGYPGTYEELISTDGSRSERWTMEIGGRTLLITIRAEPNTTEAQLEEVHAIIESIRYEPTETGGFRVTFTLPFGWDSG